MKKWWLIVMMGLVACGLQASNLTNAPACIELPDQFEKLQRLAFPNTNLTVLTIADRKGSEQIAGWIAPVKQRFGTRLDIRGIADVSPVPRILRGMVRKQFQKAQSYPVMLDWSGEAVNAFTYVPDQVNVLVMDGSGKILLRITGAANDAALHKLYEVIDRALAGHESARKP